MRDRPGAADRCGGRSMAWGRGSRGSRRWPWEVLVTIDITVRKMTSDVSPEYAVRVSGGGVEEWRLSWLPRRRLSREQARAGMELDEVLSDPGAVYDEGRRRGRRGMRRGWGSGWIGR